jgi:hypothetical protein
MKLLRMRKTENRNGERMISVVCGVPSVTLGLGGIVLLLSYLVGSPIGSPKFYNIEFVQVTALDTLGKPMEMRPAEFIIPSILMLWTLCLGACCGGLGIYLTRLRWRDRSARTSATGLIACSVAFALAWLLVAYAAI